MYNNIYIDLIHMRMITVYVEIFMKIMFECSKTNLEITGDVLK